MKRAEKITHLVQEAACRKMTLFFGSQKSGLKGEISPRIPQSVHGTHMRRSPTLYASDDKAYAAAFTFEWSENDGFEFGKSGEKGIYTLKVPYRFLSKLKTPCSLYTVEGCFSSLRTSTPEYVTHDPITIVKERRYKSVDNCLKDNGVNVTIIQVSKGK